jgi:hypothetical protein
LCQVLRRKTDAQIVFISGGLRPKEDITRHHKLDTSFNWADHISIY